MSEPDTIYEVHNAHTAYRLRPNPDAEPGTGYRHGAVLEWKDDGEPWSGHFFIAPEALPALAKAFGKAVQG